MVGYVEQKWSLFYPKFVIKTADGEEIMEMEGPLCGCECCSDVDFNINSSVDGSEVWLEIPKLTSWPGQSSSGRGPH